jgi:hypothetical protein
MTQPHLVRVVAISACSLAVILALITCGRADQLSTPTQPDPVTGMTSNETPSSDQFWVAPTGKGWSYLRRAGSKDDKVVTDATPPFAEKAVLQIVFTPDMRPDTEPGVHWISLPRVGEVHAEWWIKLSPNWTSSPAGGGKMTFLWAAPDGQGQVYTGLFGAREPHHVAVNTEWMPYGQQIWEPNVKKTPIYYNRWYRIGWHVKWPTKPGGHDGLLRWWVDGTLDGSYTSVRFPMRGVGFHQFEFAPTLQNPPPVEQYMYIGPTRIRTW